MADSKKGERISADKLPDILGKGEVLKEKWEVVRKLSAGGFGQVYLAVDMRTNAEIAVKTELISSEKQLIKMEVAVFKALREFTHVPTFLGCGRSTKFNFIAMSLVGENLAELRKQQRAQKFSLSTVCYLCWQALDALRCVHEAGILHRDVKPSNFAIGLSPDRRRLYILDFGLARFYRATDGTHLPARRSAGFRGTSRFASLNAHRQKELSRRDDLWSLFYMAIELAKGELPWRKLKAKADIERSKIEHPPSSLTEKLPPAFGELAIYIDTLKYDGEPDYEYLCGLFKNTLFTLAGRLDVPLDWEPTSTPAERAVGTTAATSSNASVTALGKCMGSKTPGTGLASIAPTTTALAIAASLSISVPAVVQSQPPNASTEIGPSRSNNYDSLNNINCSNAGSASPVPFGRNSPLVGGTIQAQGNIINALTNSGHRAGAAATAVTSSKDKTCTKEERLGIAKLVRLPSAEEREGFGATPGLPVGVMVFSTSTERMRARSADLSSQDAPRLVRSLPLLVTLSLSLCVSLLLWICILPIRLTFYVYVFYFLISYIFFLHSPMALILSHSSLLAAHSTCTRFGFVRPQHS